MPVPTAHRHVRPLRATLVTAGAALAAVTVLAGPSSAGDRPSASVSPSSAVAGSSVRVSGDCDASDTTGVSLSLFVDLGNQGKPTGVTASGSVSGGAASFSVPLRLPAGLAAGSYRVEVSCHRPANGIQLSAPFRIVGRPAVPAPTPAHPAQPVRTSSRFTG